MSVVFDTSELDEFARDLAAAPEAVGREVRGSVKHAGVKIKKQLRAEMAGSKHFKGITRAIGFDVVDGGLGVEVGPSSEAGSPGNLANIAYFGSARGGGTVPDPERALQQEVPEFRKAVERAIEKGFLS